MSKSVITTPKLADKMHMPVESVYRMLTHPEFASFRPDKSYHAKLSLFNERQALLMLIAGDAVRFGMKAPLAGSIAERAAEALAFDPNADAVHFEFRAIGANFAFTTDEPPEAATAAGAARFRLTFDIAAYRAVVAVAMSDDDEG